LVGKGEFDLALSSYKEAIRLEPGRASFYLNRSIAWHQTGEFARALDDLGETVRLDPKNALAFNNRALLRRDQGDYDQALADFDAAIRLDPSHRLAYANRGEIWRLKGNLDNALADQNRQIELDPKNELGYMLRGDTLRYKGEYERALADYDAVLKFDGSDIPPLTGKGLTYEKMGDVARARIEFEKALHSTSQNRYDMSRSALATAQAHLAALDSGETVPVIPAAPAKAINPTSIPTQPIKAPILTAAVPAERKQATERMGRRVALVIGNSRYQKVPELANPQNDAAAVAKALNNIGFETTALIDAPKDKLIAALRVFAEASDHADWAMVYYAGHGIEVNGQNYLIPTDAALKTDRDVQFEAIQLDQVMATIDGARKIKLVVLDACRDNPFAPVMEKTGARAVASASTAGGTIGTRSVGHGLGEVKVSGASLVVFAAKHGQTALDGEGGNSPFATALVQRIATPGVEINKVFRLVRDDVMEVTAGRQEPYTYGSLPGREDFYFLAVK
jgi:tetratricopeptide (TPR) repeat protein